MHLLSTALLRPVLLRSLHFVLHIRLGDCDLW